MLEQEYYRPRNASDGELRRAGVEVIDRLRFWLRCLDCGQLWSPNFQRGGRLPRGYWKCPRCWELR